MREANAPSAEDHCVVGSWNLLTEPDTLEYVTVYAGRWEQRRSPVALIRVTEATPAAAAIKIGYRIAACPELAGGTAEAIDLRGRPELHPEHGIPHLGELDCTH